MKGGIVLSNSKGNGKYKEWLKENNLIRLTDWIKKEEGATDKDISKYIGISTTTFYEWIKKYPEIKKAVEEGKEPTDIKVENAMYKSALGYFVEEEEFSIQESDRGTTKKTKKTKRYIPPNITAQIFWLKNRNPKEWRDRHDIDSGINVVITGADELED